MKTSIAAAIGAALLLSTAAANADAVYNFTGTTVSGASVVGQFDVSLDSGGAGATSLPTIASFSWTSTGGDPRADETGSSATGQTATWFPDAIHGNGLGLGTSTNQGIGTLYLYFAAMPNAEGAGASLCGPGTTCSVSHIVFFSGSDNFTTVSITPAAPTVPLPGSMWLLGSGALGLVGVSRRRKTA